MADGRFLSKDVAYDVQLNSVSLQADFLFTRMLPHLDREGRMPGNPRQVKALAVPMRDEFTPEVVERCLLELSDASLPGSDTPLVRWYMVRGRMCLEFPAFEKNQKGLRKDREKASDLPSPQDDGSVEVTEDLLDGSGPTPEDSGGLRTPPAEVEVEEEVEGRGTPPSGSKDPSVVAPLSNGGPVDDSPDPHEWMHEVWHEVLGIEGHPIKLTDKRRTKYRAMYDEQLDGTPDPEAAWRAVLFAVTQSEHHMSQRSYQMPESILRNEERRSTWVQNTISVLRDGGRDVDRKAKRRQEEIRRGLEASMEAGDAA